MGQETKPNITGMSEKSAEQKNRAPINEDGKIEKSPILHKRPKWDLPTLRSKREIIIESTKKALAEVKHPHKAAPLLEEASEIFLEQYSYYRGQPEARREIAEIAAGLEAVQNITQELLAKSQVGFGWEVPEKMALERKTGEEEKRLKVPMSLAVFRNEIANHLAFVKEKEGLENKATLEELKARRESVFRKFQSIESQFSAMERLLAVFEPEQTKNWQRELWKNQMYSDVLKYLNENPDSEIFEFIETTFKKAPGLEKKEEKAKRYATEFVNRFMHLENSREDLMRQLRGLDHLIKIKKEENKKEKQ